MNEITNQDAFRVELAKAVKMAEITGRADGLLLAAKIVREIAMPHQCVAICERMQQEMTKLRDVAKALA